MDDTVMTWADYKKKFALDRVRTVSLLRPVCGLWGLQRAIVWLLLLGRLARARQIAASQRKVIQSMVATRRLAVAGYQQTTFDLLEDITQRASTENELRLMNRYHSSLRDVSRYRKRVWGEWRELHDQYETVHYWGTVRITGTVYEGIYDNCLAAARTRLLRDMCLQEGIGHMAEFWNAWHEHFHSK